MLLCDQAVTHAGAAAVASLIPPRFSSSSPSTRPPTALTRLSPSRSRQLHVLAILHSGPLHVSWPDPLRMDLTCAYTRLFGREKIVLVRRALVLRVPPVLPTSILLAPWRTSAHWYTQLPFGAIHIKGGCNSVNPYCNPAYDALSEPSKLCRQSYAHPQR